MGQERDGFIDVRKNRLVGRWALRRLWCCPWMLWIRYKYVCCQSFVAAKVCLLLRLPESEMYNTISILIIDVEPQLSPVSETNCEKTSLDSSSMGLLMGFAFV